MTLQKVYAEALNALAEFIGDAIDLEEVQQLPLDEQYRLLMTVMDKVRSLYSPNPASPTHSEAVLQSMFEGLLPRPNADPAAWTSRVAELAQVGQKRGRSDADDVTKPSVEGVRVGSEVDQKGVAIANAEVKLVVENGVLETEIEKLHNDVAQDQLLRDKADNETKSVVKASAEEKAEIDHQELEASRDNEKNNTALKRISIEYEQLEKKKQ